MVTEAGVGAGGVVAVVDVAAAVAVVDGGGAGVVDVAVVDVAAVVVAAVVDAGCVAGAVGYTGCPESQHIRWCRWYWIMTALATGVTARGEGSLLRWAGPPGTSVVTAPGDTHDRGLERSLSRSHSGRSWYCYCCSGLSCPEAGKEAASRRQHAAKRRASDGPPWRCAALDNYLVM